MSSADILKSIGELNIRLKAIYLEENELIRIKDVIARLINRIDDVNEQIKCLEPFANEKIKLKNEMLDVKLNLDALIHTKATLGPIKRAMTWLSLTYPQTMTMSFPDILKFLDIERPILVDKKAKLVLSVNNLAEDDLRYQNLLKRREYLQQRLEIKESEYDEASTIAHNLRNDINIIETLQKLL